MKLVVLCDNNTYIDNLLYGEPALSFYIENGKDKILFDLGYSNVFKTNAKLLDIKLNEVNKIILSHGHNDHTRGLKYFETDDKIKLYCCPGCFEKKRLGDMDLTAPYKDNKMEQLYDLSYVNKMKELSKNLYFLGPIPRNIQFENITTKLEREEKGQWIEDKVIDDSALVYDGKDGLTIITGCSHSGICNIMEYAKQQFNNKKINILIGGLHLLELNEKAIKTVEYMKSQNISQIYAGHCTCLDVKAEMIKNGLPVHEVGSGLILEIK